MCFGDTARTTLFLTLCAALPMMSRSFLFLPFLPFCRSSRSRPRELALSSSSLSSQPAFRSHMDELPVCTWKLCR